MSFRAQREILLFKISHIHSRWQVCLLSFRALRLFSVRAPREILFSSCNLSFRPLLFTQCRLREKSLFRRSNTTEESRSLTVPSLELTLSKAEGLRTRFEMTRSVRLLRGSVPLNDISMLSLRNSYHTFDKNCHYFGLWLWEKFKILCFYNQLCFWTNSHFSGINIALFKINTWFVNVNLF